MVQISAVEGVPWERSCDILLVDGATPATRTRVLGGGETRVGAPRLLPGGGSRARMLAVAGGGKIADEMEAALLAASGGDQIRILCVPIEEMADDPRLEDVVRQRIAGIASAISDGAPPQLRLVELVCTDPRVRERCAQLIEKYWAHPKAPASPEGPRFITEDQPLLDAVAEARKSLDRGDLVEAYSTASRLLEQFRNSQDLRYIQTLALARMGDTAEAQLKYDEYRFSSSSSKDERALGARLKKDAAFLAPEAERQALLADAADAYAQIAETGGAFPLINAATLAQLAGQPDVARSRAFKVMDDADTRIGGGYWTHATRAEALILLDRMEEAEAELREALQQADCSDGSRSSTAKQFDRLNASPTLPNKSLDHLLAILKPPPIAYYCGHIFVSDPRAEARLTAAVDALLTETGVSIGYGSAAAGADILFAERLLARGGEAHIVLPFDQNDFVEASVRPAGADWLARFQTVLSRATSVRFASAAQFVADEGQFENGNSVAMGLTRLRALQRSCDSVQLAIWDGKHLDNEAGTSGSIRGWQRTGGRTRAILPGEIKRPPASARANVPPIGTTGRGNYPIIFTDFQGFSRISENLLPRFVHEVLGEAARVIEAYDSHILGRNSWGDALFLVPNKPAIAAEIALALQSAMAAFDNHRLGIAEAGMRIALHYGPVYRALDPITKAANFFGSEVSRAARLEPVTPPNSIYATEPIAAALEFTAPGRYGLHFAGQVSFAKNNGTYPVYKLSSKQS